MEFDITIEGTKLRVIADLTPCNDLDFVSVYPLDSATEIYGLLDERFQRKIDGVTKTLEVGYKWIWGWRI